jgi:H+/Cl- antiporter ClcA
VKRDVDTVLTYPAVMGSVFVPALQVGVSLGLAVAAACFAWPASWWYWRR